MKRLDHREIIAGHKLLWMVLLCAIWAGPTTHVQAQTIDKAGLARDAILIEADDGIEWRRKDRVYEAKGNVVAIRGDITVHGDILRAFYRESDPGDTDIYQLESIGHVVISSPDMEARGDRAVYNIDTGVIVLSGTDVQLDTEKYRIYAAGSLEYHDVEKYAVATGGAKAISGDREITADTLYAYFAPGGDANAGDLSVERLVAEGNMVIVTANEIVQADLGTYFPQTEIANAEGNVQITRGGSHLVGESARVDMITGVSQITAGNGRVLGLFTPGTFESEN